jgi:ketosteroid isomerase-like protein
MTLRSMLITSVVVLGLALPAMGQHPVFAQGAADSIKDRIEIQENLLFAYAYAYDAKDCVSWSNLFTTDAVLDLTQTKASGREAILQVCIATQKNVVGDIKTRHNMMNIVFDRLTPNRAETRTYILLTWQKPGDQVPTVQSAATYRDVIVKTDDGRWLFKERKAIDSSRAP